MGYELHPETPAEGVMLNKLFSGFDPNAMVERLVRAGAPYGIGFNRLERLSNSRLALEASEFARDRGGFHQLHTAFFEAYFLEGRDIGSLATVMEVAGAAGLDTGALEAALHKGVYRERLAKARELGVKHQVAGLPTFIFNGAEKLVGAREYEAFTRTVKKLLS
jgi:predicted DsbA family dithiol-disulfide isomerase